MLLYLAQCSLPMMSTVFSTRCVVLIWCRGPQAGVKFAADLQCEASGLNLFLAGHEDEDITSGVTQMNGNGLLHCSLHVVFLWRLAEEGFHWEGAPGNLEDWHAAKEV